MGSYTAKDIVALDGIDAVRKRPAMFIDDVGEGGFHRLLWEVLDNSIDEALAGYCDQINIVVEKGGFVSIKDNGRGIPTGKHPDPRFGGSSALEVVLTSLYAGGKFDKCAYKVSGGLHGVGVSVTNALSDTLEAYVWRQNKLWMVSYTRGVANAPISRLSLTKSTTKKLTDASIPRELTEVPVRGTGTLIRFRPDQTMFGPRKFSEERISKRCDELAYLNPGLAIIFTYLDEDEVIYHHKGGLKDYVLKLKGNKSAIHHKPEYISQTRDEVLVEIGFYYTYADGETFLSFVNNIPTIEGGTHAAGFRSAFTRTINSFSEKHGLNKNGSLSGEDVREGLVSIISLKVPEPEFMGQTKYRLGNAEVRKIVDNVVSEHLSKWLDKNIRESKLIVERAITSRKAREAAKRAREATKGKRRGLPKSQGSFVPCSSRNTDECELFIVEGNSAGGTAKQGRDRRTQAILPLRGKVRNVEKVDVGQVLKNREIQSMISVIGTGIELTGIFNYDDLRYNRIIIMCDADEDGAHIQILILTFFFRYLPTLIREGHVFVACPPLYKITKGRSVVYVINEEEKEQVVEKMLTRTGKMEIQRYKGLGEMNSDQLWETTMDPDSRTLIQVKIEDEEATANAFEELMGTDPSHRRDFIFLHALEAEVEV